MYYVLFLLISKFFAPHAKSTHTTYLLPTAEILSGKNARAFLVCGFFMKSFKKIILKK